MAQSSCDSYLLAADAASPSTVLSVEAINSILVEHNNARRSVSPAAAEMPMLQWDQTLANFAQEYMDGCPGLVHSSSSVRSNPTRFNFSYVGENLAAGTSSGYGVSTGGQRSTAAWNGELSDWTYPRTCSGVCGHYTQVIWAATTHVGCGYKYCANERYRNYWSCVYGPGGNYNGQNPYVQASASAGTAACQVTSSSPALTPAPIGPVTPAPPGSTTLAPPVAPSSSSGTAAVASLTIAAAAVMACVGL
jgi:uncharacterized protein YkwD